MWTDQRIETLRTMWANGFSGTEIGDELGITRNSAIGKLHRLGLSKLDRKHPAAPLQRKPPTRAEPRRPIQGYSPVPPLAPVEPDVPITKHLCTIEGLNNRTCRYPCWSDDALPLSQKFYCGIPTANEYAGRPYCAHHASLCFNEPQARQFIPYRYGNGERAA